MLAWQGDGRIFDAWVQNISSAALYTFSISLVVSSMALVGSELIDAVRKQVAVQYFEYKVVWSVVAAALLILQAPLAGALLSKTDHTTFQEERKFAIEFRSHDLPSSDAQNASKLSPEEARFQAEKLAQPNELTAINDGKSVHGLSTQTILWVASMLTALILFCLYRIPLVADNYAEERNKEIENLAAEAADKDATSFGEAI